MTVIVYQCDVCNREITIPQNPQGLETVGRCIITRGCRGRLHQIDVKPDFVRGVPPTPVSGLEDWVQRKVLYTHTQTVQSRQWKIIHNLGIKPTVQVFVLNPQNVQVEIFPSNITIVDLNEIILDFNELEAGVAQLTTASSENITNLEVPVTTTIVPQQLSNSSELTIATLDTTDITVPLELTFKASPDQIVPYTILFNASSLLSPWADFPVVFIKNRPYKVRSFQVLNPLILNGTIRNSTPVTFTTLNALPITSGSVLILLANSPFKTVDKITGSFLDVTKINSTLPQMYYSNGDFFAPNNLISTTFPNIRKV